MDGACNRLLSFSKVAACGMSLIGFLFFIALMRFGDGGCTKKGIIPQWGDKKPAHNHYFNRLDAL
jgi:hypothetical protein